ncbi:MAG TPA: hypothetical protein VFT82_03645 [Candidatus Paceibacterota bacterium]|nr:hypothetical protein [Candidatus Paceibacterota bacterium]
MKKRVGTSEAGSLALIEGHSGELTKRLRSVHDPNHTFIARKGVEFDEIDLMQIKWTITVNGREIEAGTLVVIVEMKGTRAVVEIFRSPTRECIEIPKDDIALVDQDRVLAFENPVAV